MRIINRNLKIREGLAFPTNVRVIRKSSSGKLIQSFESKNRVLKDIGLYSYARFILGSFNNNGSLFDYKQYVPKYLAVGSNEAPLTGAPGTTTAVQITDISLYHELDDTSVTGEPITNNRIKLNRANYIEDNINEPYVKIQYEAYIPEDRFVGMTIGELGLMTLNTGWNAYARISGFEPFVKQENEVVQVIWEISIISVESNTRFSPVIKTYLQEAVDKAINVLQAYTADPVDEKTGETIEGARKALDALIEPYNTEGTGLYYILNDNESITQELINNYLSKPFVSVNDTGLIPLIQKFDSKWQPNFNIVS